MNRALWLALAAFLVLFPGACAPRNSDDTLVSSAHALQPCIVLLTMRVPPENEKAQYDDAYATGTVVASGDWGSDILTVQHAVDGAWDLHATVGDKRRVPASVIAQDADLDVALVRTSAASLPVAKLGSSDSLKEEIGRELALLGYPIPDKFTDQGLELATSLNTGNLSSVRKGALEVSLQIAPGESGAPIFVADTGEIVGIAEARFDDEHAIGLALPIDAAKAFLHDRDAVHGF